MMILSHRGYWLEPSEKNTQAAFARSFKLGFGTETDVRDCAGKLVISHDMPTLDTLSLDAFLSIYGDCQLPLAINIKSDGLVTSLKAAMDAAGITNWFVFDMSIPDTRGYLKAGVPVFGRMSEVEQTPAWVEQLAGVWLDAFSHAWYDVKCIKALLDKGLRVCVVSPELHGRDHLPCWEMLRELFDESGLLLCTDFPEQAKDYFKGALV